MRRRMMRAMSEHRGWIVGLGSGLIAGVAAYVGARRMGMLPR